MASSPRNVLTIKTRKGAEPGVGQNPQTAIIRTDVQVVAGSELTEPENIRAGWALHAGVVWQQAVGMSDSMVTMVI
jgi:hypothetical protein